MRTKPAPARHSETIRPTRPPALSGSRSRASRLLDHYAGDLDFLFDEGHQLRVRILAVRGYGQIELARRIQDGERDAGLAHAVAQSTCFSPMPLWLM